VLICFVFLESIRLSPEGSLGYEAAPFPHTSLSVVDELRRCMHRDTKCRAQLQASCGEVWYSFENLIREVSANKYPHRSLDSTFSFQSRSLHTQTILSRVVSNLPADRWLGGLTRTNHLHWRITPDSSIPARCRQLFMVSANQINIQY